MLRLELELELELGPQQAQGQALLQPERGETSFTQPADGVRPPRFLLSSWAVARSPPGVVELCQ